MLERNSRRLVRSVVILTVFLGCVSEMPVLAEDRPFRDVVHPALGDRDVGIVFNSTNILLGLESYQGGVGFKIGFAKVILRSYLDIVVHGSLSPLAVQVGGVLEKHLIESRVSPYIGAGLDVGLFFQKTTVDADNWQQTINLPVTAAGVLGVEIFVLEFLSVFAEYSLRVAATYALDRTSTAAVVTPSGQFDLMMDLGMGNDARIGVVIYFRRRDPTRL